MRVCPHKLIGWMCLAGWVGLTGCRTTDQASTGHMASVEIHGHTEAEIREATTKAFLAGGFVAKDRLTFEKKGSAWDTFNYGGWSADLVRIRVRANIVAPDLDTHILGCDAFIVSGRDDFMETERKPVFAKRSECKKILDAAKAMLEAPSAAAESSQAESP
jgi:hypothetical protein